MEKHICVLAYPNELRDCTFIDIINCNLIEIYLGSCTFCCFSVLLVFFETFALNVPSPIIKYAWQVFTCYNKDKHV